MPASFAKRILYLSMFIALAARLPLAWKGPDLLIPKVVSDDMFYYLTIARNIAEGHGATADGEHISNGFHFLYTSSPWPQYRAMTMTCSSTLRSPCSPSFQSSLHGFSSVSFDHAVRR